MNIHKQPCTFQNQLQQLDSMMVMIVTVIEYSISTAPVSVETVPYILWYASTVVLVRCRVLRIAGLLVC